MPSIRAAIPLIPLFRFPEPLLAFTLAEVIKKKGEPVLSESDERTIIRFFEQPYLAIHDVTRAIAGTSAPPIAAIRAKAGGRCSSRRLRF